MTLSHVKSYGRFLIFSSIWINEGDAEYDLHGGYCTFMFLHLFILLKSNLILISNKYIDFDRVQFFFLLNLETFLVHVVCRIITYVHVLIH